MKIFLPTLIDLLTEAKSLGSYILYRENITTEYILNISHKRKTERMT